MAGRSSGSHVTEMVAYTLDQADPKSADPVARHSSHLTCIVAYAATSPDDPRLYWDTHTAINGLLMAQRLKQLEVPHKVIMRLRKYPERTANELAWLRLWNGK